MSTLTEAEVIGDFAQIAAEPTPLEKGTIYSVKNGDTVKVIDTDSYLDRPRRKTGLGTVRDSDSFIAYLDKHGLSGETEIYAYQRDNKITASIDAGTDEEAGWAGHKLTLLLEKSPEFTKWISYSGKLLTQTEFSEFVEENAADIMHPAAAEMLEIVSSLQVARSADFESAVRLSDGNVQFGYRETTNAKAGTTGQLTIPTEFSLGIRPYLGGKPYQVQAKFRYRLRGSELLLGYKLERVDDILVNAFDGVAESIREHALGNDFLYLNS
ncbi:DUF2303 family protein [Glutamicibacter arilaitensis]|uniref:DUF2303 family protein n=1 Tax=Glutamicibacter arilaitensis TaxID=256701 RepID=UPI0038515BC0